MWEIHLSKERAKEASRKDRTRDLSHESGSQEKNE